MTQKIKQHLKNIKSEVNEVHPLLEMLFEKMQQITQVEYKQGPSENGADFVLVKADDLLDIEEYIGVVVRKDGIKKTSDDVYRQIDECITTPRIINGKRGIVLDEVWVITPGNITNSAQEYFQNKFSSTKIKFVGYEKLAHLINKYMPDYFQGVPLAINNYIIKTKEKLTNIEKNSQLTFHALSDININQDLIPIDRLKYKDGSGRKRRPPSKTNLFKALEKKSSILIEGGMGSGKSTLLRNAAAEMLNPDEFEKSQRLPIYIAFKDFGTKYNFITKDLISKEIGNVDEELKYILLLDGVDESKHDLSERAKIIDSIIEFIDSQPNMSLVMTARNLDENAIKSKLSHSFKTFQIAPLSLKQIVNVLEDTCKTVNIKNKIIEDLKKSALYKALPQTPIAAILLAKLLNENQHDIPSNLTELYSKYTELALGRWDINKNLNTQKEYSVCNSVTKLIAEHFIKYDLTKISIEEALGFFSDYLKDRNLGLDAADIFDRMMERCELFYIDESSGTFGFKHRTFIEFFYALHLSDENNVTITEEAFELYWATINFFWVGLKKDCPKAIRAYADVKTTHERTRILKIINLGNILLAGYESPNDAIEHAIEKVFIESAQFLNDTIEGKTDTRLAAFSEMQLTAIFRHLMADSYGYDFFASAIDNAMLAISSKKSLSDKDKATTLFLLNTAQTAPVIDKLFDSIAETNLINTAPLSVQLAIQHEAKDRNIHNEHIKKVQRNIKKILSDRAATNHMKTLYDRPLNKLNLK